MNAGRHAAPAGLPDSDGRALRWRIRGASVQGYAHVREGKWCEDSFTHISLPGGGVVPDIHVIAVADGAGTEPRSAEGSRLAVGIATRTVRDRIHAVGVPQKAAHWEQLLASCHGDIVAEFQRAVTALAGPGGANQFATTLTLVVLAYPVIGYLSIGDGFIVVRTGGGGEPNLHLLDSATAAAEDARRTVFLTSDTSRAARIHAMHDPGVTGVFVSTDGLIPVTLRRGSDGRLALAAEPVVDRVLGLLDEDDFDAQGLVRLLLRKEVTTATQDDTTLVVAVLCQ